MKITLLVLVFVAAAIVAIHILRGREGDQPALLKMSGAAKPFVNDICIPSSLYMLEDTQNDIFAEAIIKRWRPYNDYVRFELKNGSGFMRRLERVASITNPKDGSILTTSLVNGDEFETIKQIESVIRTGVKGAGTGTVTAQIFGDSFTHGQFYAYALEQSGMVPNLELVGLRRDDRGQHNEGRGGWSLGSYSEVPTAPARSYHGFLQPEGDFRYYGASGFWVNAWKVFRNTAGNGFEPKYSCCRYDDELPRFDEATGFLKQPQKGDVQFDNQKNTFVVFDGAAWIPKQKSDFKWSFDYGKYLQMWQLNKPQFLFVVLGVNDFRDRLNADFSDWKIKITELKESYLKAVPEGKFVLCLQSTTMGSINNKNGDFTPKQNAALWRFRKFLCDNFDKREDDGFYLLDIAITTDSEYGYNLSEGAENTPHERYTGKESLRLQAGNPHPYPNYPAMGYPIAAFIQYHRTDK